MKRVAACFFLLLILVLSLPMDAAPAAAGPATAGTAETPEALAASYFTFLQQRAWDRVAGMFDPAALKEFRQMLAFFDELPDDLSAKVLPAFFGPGADKKQVREMSDVRFFENVFRTVMAQAKKQGAVDFRKIEVLGSVEEGPEVRHVLVRVHMGVADTSLESTQVLSFRNSGSGWMLMMKEKMKGTAQQIRHSIVQGR